MIYLNPSYDPAFRLEQPTRDALRFHSRLPEYVPTALHALPELAMRFGIERVFVKDESRRLGLPAFKILGASWAAYTELLKTSPARAAAWLSGEIGAASLQDESFHLFAATDGNHGRAVARVGKMLGVKANIYVPKGTVAARIEGIESEGALVTIVEGTYDDTVRQAEHDAKVMQGLLIQDSGWEGYEHIPQRIIEGYSTLFWEVDDALEAMDERQPTHVIMQIGVGSFADAAVRHYGHRGTLVLGVEPESAACGLESVKAGRVTTVPGPHPSIMVGMNCDTLSLISWPVLQKGVAAYMTIADERAREAMQWYATRRIVSGETGASGLGAALELFAPENKSLREQLQISATSRLLIVSTEGATDPASYASIVDEATT